MEYLVPDPYVPPYIQGCDQQVMVKLRKPKDFSSLFTIVSCVFLHQNKTLILHRRADKSQGNKWGMPSGKVEKSETLYQAMSREIVEETGLKFAENELHHFKKIFVNSSGKQFEYHLFYKNLETLPEVTINTVEHTEYKWVDLKEIFKYDLVEDHP